MRNEHTTAQQNKEIVFDSNLLFIPVAFVFGIFALLAFTPTTDLDKGGSIAKAIKHQPSVKTSPAKTSVELKPPSK